MALNELVELSRAASVANDDETLAPLIDELNKMNLDAWSQLKSDEMLNALGDVVHDHTALLVYTL